MKSNLLSIFAGLTIAAQIFAAEPTTPSPTFLAQLDAESICPNTAESKELFESLEAWEDALKEKGLDLALISDLIARTNLNNPKEVEAMKAELAKLAAVEVSEFSEAIEWVLKNIPNAEEMWLDVRWQVPIDLLLGPITSKIANPAAKTGIRKITKSKAIHDKKALGARIGRTEYRVDDANVYAHYSSIGVMVLVTAGMTYLTGDPEISAVFANYPADWVSRLITLWGEKRQDKLRGTNETQAFLEFVRESADYGDLQAAQNQAVPKTLGSNLWGDVVKFSGAINGLNTAYYWALNRFLPVAFKCGSNIYANADQLMTYTNTERSGLGGHAKYAGAFVTSFLLMAPSGYLSTIGNTYLMAPMARMITNGMKRIDGVLDTTGQIMLNVLFVGGAAGASWYKISNSRHQKQQKATIRQLSKLAAAVAELKKAVDAVVRKEVE